MPDHQTHHDPAVRLLIEQAEARGAVRALREAADDVDHQVRKFEVGCEADAGYYDAHMEIRKMLRDRAARIACEDDR